MFMTIFGIVCLCYFLAVILVGLIIECSDPFGQNETGCVLIIMGAIPFVISMIFHYIYMLG